MGLWRGGGGAGIPACIPAPVASSAFPSQNHRTFTWAQRLSLNAEDNKDIWESWTALRWTGAQIYTGRDAYFKFCQNLFELHIWPKNEYIIIKIPNFEAPPSSWCQSQQLIWLAEAGSRQLFVISRIWGPDHMTPSRHTWTRGFKHTECSVSLTWQPFPTGESGSPPDVHTMFSPQDKKTGGGVWHREGRAWPIKKMKREVGKDTRGIKYHVCDSV